MMTPCSIFVFSLETWRIHEDKGMVQIGWNGSAQASVSFCCLVRLVAVLSVRRFCGGMSFVDYKVQGGVDMYWDDEDTGAWSWMVYKAQCINPHVENRAGPGADVTTVNFCIGDRVSKQWSHHNPIRNLFTEGTDSAAAILRYQASLATTLIFSSTQRLVPLRILFKHR